MDVRWKGTNSRWCESSSCDPEVEVITRKSKMAKIPAVDIDFSDLYYTVRVTGLNGKKEILKGISGNFRSGQLTAIMGISGAGKSTLMDILAGYVSSGVKGSIRINGHSRHIKMFHKISSYIMQDNLVQSRLTVLESMHIAADLKLGDEIADEEKYQIVQETLELLGLTKCCETRCEKLSGGQRKRLSVALELVSNPPILFLDEPTTGLDTVSTNDMIKLLHKLSRQGRTVILTIHQPSASIFEMFDKVYVLAEGKCVYHGTHNQLVPYLSSLGLDCPITYNPADYIIELIQGKNNHVNALTNEIQNGKISLDPFAKESEEELPVMTRSHDEDNSNKFRFPISFRKQCVILLKRRLKQQCRNPVTMWLLIVHHIASGLFLGSIFFGVADNAQRAYDNFKFIISVVVFFMYTHVMCPALLFPAEVRLLQREHFNRWYSLKSYYTALTISTLPSHIILGLVLTAICYVLSGQPLDITRYFLFAVVGLLVGLASEGWGLTIGAIFDEMNGSVMGPASIVPLLAVSVYGIGYGSAVEPGMQYLMSASYLRYGIAGFTLSLYGFNRSFLNCDYEKMDYCHYKNPALLVKDLGMEGLTYDNQLVALFTFLIIHRILAFLSLRFKLTSEFSNRIFNYASKVLRKN